MSIEVDFQRHCNEENGSLLFTAEELDGVPKDTVASYPKETVDGVEKYKVTFKTPDIIPVLYVCLTDLPTSFANLVACS